TRRVTSVAWSPDCKTLASLNADHTLRLWDPATGRLRGLVMTLLGQDQHLVMSPDGHYRGTPGVEAELVYVVQTEQGQETLGPEEFAEKYGWKNEPSRTRLAGD